LLPGFALQGKANDDCFRDLHYRVRQMISII
jgi:hypothetical protein